MLYSACTGKSRPPAYTTELELLIPRPKLNIPLHHTIPYQTPPRQNKPVSYSIRLVIYPHSPVGYDRFKIPFGRDKLTILFQPPSSSSPKINKANRGFRIILHFQENIYPYLPRLNCTKCILTNLRSSSVV